MAWKVPPRRQNRTFSAVMRHRFHSICPYFAMFPETFVEKHLCLAPTDGVILDPFSGRGTTVFQTLLSGRTGLGIDTNPLAACISRAKADAPVEMEVTSRIEEIESKFKPVEEHLLHDPFFVACFHRETLKQILWLRKQLDWRNNRVDCFIAAMAVSCLHGESHISRRVFSNRMPRTIATKPTYSIRWWLENGYVAPERDVFEILKQEMEFRFLSKAPLLRGVIKEGDARAAHELLPDWHRSVDMIITSPPYLDVTHFREDQWLRVWFLGGDPRPCSAGLGDDRHWTERTYWRFLRESWIGVAPLMKSSSQIVIRIGGKKIDETLAGQGLSQSLGSAFEHVQLRSISTSEIRKGQLRAFRPNVQGTRREFDAVFQVSH